MEYRAKGGIFHAIVRFCIAISCLSRYVCNTFSQVECELFANLLMKIYLFNFKK